DGCRVLHMAVAANVVRRLAVRPRDQAAEFERVARDRRMAGDRRLARAVERGEEGALAGERRERLGVIDARQRLARARIVGPRLDADGALADGGEKLVDAHDRRGVRLKAKTLQAGEREQGRVGLAGVEL